MNKPDQIPTDKLPIENITDAWFLQDGSLYLTVKCPDGAQRTVTLPMPIKRS